MKYHQNLIFVFQNKNVWKSFTRLLHTCSITYWSCVLSILLMPFSTLLNVLIINVVHDFHAKVYLRSNKFGCSIQTDYFFAKQKYFCHVGVKSKMLSILWNVFGHPNYRIQDKNCLYSPSSFYIWNISKSWKLTIGKIVNKTCISPQRWYKHGWAESQNKGVETKIVETLKILKLLQRNHTSPTLRVTKP